jgi:hypothetical protein
LAPVEEREGNDVTDELSVLVDERGIVELDVPGDVGGVESTTCEDSVTEGTVGTVGKV